MEVTLNLKGIVSNDIDKQSGQATVYLIEDWSNILLPITIDLHSAEAVMLAQQNFVLPRPHTHDLIKRLINCMQGKLLSVIIYDIHDDIYYAYLRISYDNEIFEIDARPSDAISLALRFGAPILAKEEVLTRGGIKINPDTF